MALKSLKTISAPQHPAPLSRVLWVGLGIDFKHLKSEVAVILVWGALTKPLPCTLEEARQRTCGWSLSQDRKMIDHATAACQQNIQPVVAGAVELDRHTDLCRRLEKLCVEFFVCHFERLACRRPSLRIDGLGLLPPAFGSSSGNHDAAMSCKG